MDEPGSSQPRIVLDAACKIDVAREHSKNAFPAPVAGFANLRGDVALSDRSSPRYVNRWGIRGSLVPFAGRGADAFVFLFEGERDNLEDLCRRYLAEPSGGRVEYRPLTTLIALIFSRTRQLIATDPPYSGMGWLPELEAAFWVLTAQVVRYGSTAFADHLAWFVPYIFVDSALAIVEGREIFGFPKEIGWLAIPEDHTETEQLTLDAHAVQRFDSLDLQGRRQRLLAISRAGDAPSARTARPLQEFADVVRIFSGLIGERHWLLPPDLTFVSDLLKDVVHHQGRIVALKQFPEAQNTDQACYQAIVETPLEATSFRQGALLAGEYELTLGDFDSHPIRRDLGLQASQRAILGYWLDFDFTFKPGTMIWKSS